MLCNGCQCGLLPFNIMRCSFVALYGSGVTGAVAGAVAGTARSWSISIVLSPRL